MSRKRPAEAVATVRVGDTVVRHPLTILEPGQAKNAKDITMKGEVVYIHPRGKFHVVEFAGGIRESFVGIMR